MIRNDKDKRIPAARTGTAGIFLQRGISSLQKWKIGNIPYIK